MFSATTRAASGNSIWPMLRMAMVLGPRGVSITALNGRIWPFSTYTRILHGVLSGPCHSSMSASSGRPSVLRTTCTCSTAGERYDQVRREPPCTRMEESTPMLAAVPALRVPAPVMRMGPAPVGVSPAYGRAVPTGGMGSVDSSILVQGGSLRTWSYRSPAVEQVQVVLSTEGRPLDADIELWHGPDNTPVKMRVYCENG